MFSLACIFSLGILFARLFVFGFIFYFALSSAGLITGIIFRRSKIICNLAVGAAFFFLGGVILRNSEFTPADHINRYIYYQNEDSYVLKGVVESQPQVEGKRASFILRCSQIQEGQRLSGCSGRVMAYLNENYVKSFVYGKQITANGRLRKIYYKGGARYNSFFDLNNISGKFFIDTAQPIIISREFKGNSLKKFAYFLKDKWQTLVNRTLSPVSAGIVEAMVMGDKKDVPLNVYDAMTKTGTVHILVVSGFNVGIVALIANLLLQLFRIRRRWRIFIILVFLVIYCLLTGASNPVVRATIMGVIFLCAYLVKREPDIYNSLAVSIFFILFINPKQLFDIGFQLSFASVISIVYLFPKLKNLLPPQLLKQRFSRFIFEGLLVSLSAWLGTCGIIFYYFRFFSPVTVLANLVIVPLASLITFCGFGLLFVGNFSDFFTGSFAVNIDLLTGLLIQANFLFQKLPGAYFTF